MFSALAKTLIRRSSHQWGIEVLKSPSLLKFLEVNEIDTVLDVGANVGQFARSLRDMGYKKSIVSFEPVSGPYRQALASAAKDPLWQVRKLGLGNQKAQSVINVTENTLYSSMVDQTALAAVFDAATKVVARETIDVVRIDDIFDEFAGKKVFLKIDTQGFEKAVLEGSCKSMPHLRGIQLELPVEHLYQSDWSLEDGIRYMASKGFLLAQCRPTRGIMPDGVSVVEFDCVFRCTTVH